MLSRLSVLPVSVPGTGGTNGQGTLFPDAFDSRICTRFPLGAPLKHFVIDGERMHELTCIRTKQTAFDPRPHIQTLERALALLLPLRKANTAKTVELERSVAAAERAYRGDVRGAKAGFEVRIDFSSSGLDRYD